MNRSVWSGLYNGFHMPQEVFVIFHHSQNFDYDAKDTFEDSSNNSSCYLLSYQRKLDHIWYNIVL